MQHGGKKVKVRQCWLKYLSSNFQVSYVNDGDFEESGELMDMYGNNVRVPRRIESFSGKIN